MAAAKHSDSSVLGESFDVLVDQAVTATAASPVTAVGTSSPVLPVPVGGIVVQASSNTAVQIDATDANVDDDSKLDQVTLEVAMRPTSTAAAGDVSTSAQSANDGHTHTADGHQQRSIGQKATGTALLEDHVGGAGAQLTSKTRRLAAAAPGAQPAIY